MCLKVNGNINWYHTSRKMESLGGQFSAAEEKGSHKGKGKYMVAWREMFLSARRKRASHGTLFQHRARFLRVQSASAGRTNVDEKNVSRRATCLDPR